MSDSQLVQLTVGELLETLQMAPKDAVVTIQTLDRAGKYNAVDCKIGLKEVIIS